MYECEPDGLACIEQAGGKSQATASGQRILDDEAPEELHQRTPVILGSPDEVEKVASFL